MSDELFISSLPESPINGWRCATMATHIDKELIFIRVKTPLVTRFTWRRVTVSEAPPLVLHDEKCAYAKRRRPTDVILVQRRQQPSCSVQGLKCSTLSIYTSSVFRHTKIKPHLQHRCVVLRSTSGVLTGSDDVTPRDKQVVVCKNTCTQS